MLPSNHAERVALLRHELAAAKAAERAARPAAAADEEAEAEGAEEEEEEEEEEEAAGVAAKAIRARALVSTAANNEAALTIVGHLQSLTSAVTTINPTAVTALRDAAGPGVLLALKGLQDASHTLLRVARNGGGGDGGGLLELAGAPPPGAPPPPLESLPVPSLWYPSPRAPRPQRLDWKGYYLLWIEGVRAGYDGEGASPYPVGRCPPLSRSSQPGDLTWARSGAFAPALSKATLLARLLLAVVAHEEKSMAHDEAVDAAVRRFNAAWTRSKEDALKGARVFFSTPDRVYEGEDLSVYHKKAALKRKAAALEAADADKAV